MKRVTRLAPRKGRSDYWVGSNGPNTRWFAYPQADGSLLLCRDEKIKPKLKPPK